MSPEEAAWFGSILRKMPSSDLSPLLNVGSSTLEYRTVACPHIETLLFAPLRRQGVQILNVDLKSAQGVDIVGNILDKRLQLRFEQLGVRSILCNNLLEHVDDIPGMCHALAEICPEGGVLCLSVPHAYPFHPDPIDNGFRPALAQLQELLGPLGFRLIDGALVSFGSYRQSLAGNPKLLLRDAYLVLAALFNREKRKVLIGNYQFFFRTYRVTCSVFIMGTKNAASKTPLES